ncbi:MAG: hypothetical protein Q9157_008571 [Trypethelium eluteriae]
MLAKDGACDNDDVAGTELLDPSEEGNDWKVDSEGLGATIAGTDRAEVAGIGEAEESAGTKVTSTPLKETSVPSDAASLMERSIETAPLGDDADEFVAAGADPLFAPGTPMKPEVLVAALGGTVRVIVVMYEVMRVRFSRGVLASMSWPASRAKTSELEYIRAEVGNFEYGLLQIENDWSGC